MAIDGPFVDVTSLSDDVTIDGDSIYSQPSVTSRQSSQSGTYSAYSGSQKSGYSGHSHSNSYCGSLKSTSNYSSIKNKRRSPPLVAPRPLHGSLKRLDRLPPPYARPASAGLHDDIPDSGIVKARSTNFNGETFTSKLTLIPDANRATSQVFGAHHFVKEACYQTPFSPVKSTEPLSPRRPQVPFAQAQAPARFDDHVYEDPEVCNGPAKLPPESGMLSKGQSKVVLRPLAFKPVMPLPSKPTPDPPSNGDEGYHSTDFRPRDYCDPTRQTEPPTPASRPGSFTSSGHSRMSSGQTETYMTTPSPSDSGVSELEAMLREKDAEISHLRQTMDGNERAIFQVFDEKKRCWHQQMDKMIHEYEEKLRQEKQKSFKSEQSLLMQIVKLQQDKKGASGELEVTRNKLAEMESKCEHLEKELNLVKSRGDEANWALHQKNGELTLLKSQLRDSKDESQHRCVELSGLRHKLSQCESDLDDTKHQLTKLQETFNEGRRHLQRSCQELDRLGLDKLDRLDSDKNQSFELSPGDRIANCDSEEEKDSNAAYQSQELKRLRTELDKLTRDKRQQEREFDDEKSRWLDEKNKVICYQKQLQLNYVQMLRKNKTLEEEVEQLMLDLERNDLKTDSHC